jgi:hypothetical protein
VTRADDIRTIREAARVVAGVWGKAELARRLEEIADRAERKESKRDK